jgi:hypothetical protein
MRRFSERFRQLLPKQKAATFTGELIYELGALLPVNL